MIGYARVSTEQQGTEAQLPDLGRPAAGEFTRRPVAAARWVVEAITGR